jgi:hypothetical protein
LPVYHTELITRLPVAQAGKRQYHFAHRFRAFPRAVVGLRTPLCVSAE